MHPACWVQLSKRPLLYLRIPCYHFLKCVHILKTALPIWMDVLGFSGYNKLNRGLGRGGGALRLHARAGGGRCVQSRLWEKEVLKHPTETNTAIQYGLFGCIYQEAIRIQPTWLLLNVTGSAMWTACPSHGPPPNPYQCQLSFSEYCFSTVTSAPFNQSHSIWKFHPYPFVH